MKKLIITVAVFAVGAAGAVQARDVGITGEIGTTGAGFHVVTPLHDQLNARIGINGLNYAITQSTDNAEFRANVRMRTFDALMDYYPMNNQLRMSAGLIYNASKIMTRAKPTKDGKYIFNSTPYSADNAGQVNGRIEFRRTAPYLGIGWGNAVAPNKGWGFTSDVGVMFQGSSRKHWTNIGCNPVIVDCAQFKADLKVELRDLDNKTRDIRFYPVIRIGATYKF